MTLFACRGSRFALRGSLFAVRCSVLAAVLLAPASAAAEYLRVEMKIFGMD